MSLFDQEHSHHAQQVLAFSLSSHVQRLIIGMKRCVPFNCAQEMREGLAMAVGENPTGPFSTGSASIRPVEEAFCALVV